MKIDLYDYCPDNCRFVKLRRVDEPVLEFDYIRTYLVCENKELCKTMFDKGFYQGYCANECESEAEE